MSTLLRPEFVVVESEASSRDELLVAMGAELVAAGYVKESYPAALLEREARYPTGLPTRPVAIAIPHTDPTHVNAALISVRKLGVPVTFREMGTRDRHVDASLVLMLCLPDGKSQLATLQQLMNAFSKPDIITKLAEATDAGQLYRDLADILRIPTASR